MADLSVQAERDKVIEQLSQVERISGLVNNAAINDPVSLLQDISVEDWQQQMAINLDAPIFMA